MALTKTTKPSIIKTRAQSRTGTTACTGTTARTGTNDRTINSAAPVAVAVAACTTDDTIAPASAGRTIDSVDPVAVATGPTPCCSLFAEPAMKDLIPLFAMILPVSGK